MYSGERYIEYFQSCVCHIIGFVAQNSLTEFVTHRFLEITRITQIKMYIFVLLTANHF